MTDDVVRRQAAEERSHTGSGARSFVQPLGAEVEDPNGPKDPKGQRYGR